MWMNNANEAIRQNAKWLTTFAKDSSIIMCVIDLLAVPLDYKSGELSPKRPFGRAERTIAYPRKKKEEGLCL